MPANNPFIRRLFYRRKQLAVIAVFTAIGSLLLYHSLAATNPNLKGDLNNDNKVTVTDLSILLSNFNKSTTADDLNGDGKVTVADLSILLTNYGKTYGGNPTPTPPSPTPPTPTPTPPGGSTAGSTVISRGAPAFASNGTATKANDNDYNGEWSPSGSSSWLAYDLSGVAAANRSSVLVAWYSNATFAYDPALSYGDETAHNYPSAYTIETNTAAGGGSAPTSGWTAAATVTGNPYHSRQHVVNMGSANWIRINISAVNGGGAPQLNMDVYPANATADDWIFYGSSTPSEAMSHVPMGNVTQTFSQMIAAAKPGYFPVQEDGGISGINTADGLKSFDKWISIFPGKYVYIGLGANDADECVSATTYYNNMKSMVDKTIAAGKTPVVATFNWSKQSTVQSCGQALVDQIPKLYAAYPQIIKGPDYWTYFKNNPSLISSDDTHPTEQGMGNYRKMMVDMMLTTVYK